jgi:3',5'-cyclic AMP phosphodiesterase CpdA
MIIAQLSDTHLTGGLPAFRKVESFIQTKKALEHLAGLIPLPELLIVTGDIADSGEREAYMAFKKLCSELPFPTFCLPGNHDDRKALLECLPDLVPAVPALSPNLSYSLNYPGILIAMLDTQLPDTHAGGLPDDVLDWLGGLLASSTAMLKIVATHHPPFNTGMGLFDVGFKNADRFTGILERHQARLLCGHVHNALFRTIGKLSCLVAPAVTARTEVRLGPQVEGRFFTGAPRFLLHVAESGELISHLAEVPATSRRKVPSATSDPLGCLTLACVAIYINAATLGV